MRLRRLLLLGAVMALPGCLVVTCGTTRPVGEQDASGARSGPEAPRGAESGY